MVLNGQNRGNKSVNIKIQLKSIKNTAQKYALYIIITSSTDIYRILTMYTRQIQCSKWYVAC